MKADIMEEYECSMTIDDELLKPQIVIPLPIEIKGKVGKGLRFFCLITGYPPHQIRWYVNNKLVSKEDDRFVFDNNQRELIIKSLSLKDAGYIKFEVTNKYGQISSVCSLDVVDKKHSGSASPKAVIGRKIHKVLHKKSST